MKKVLWLKMRINRQSVVNTAIRPLSATIINKTRIAERPIKQEIDEIIQTLGLDFYFR